MSYQSADLTPAAVASQQDQTDTNATSDALNNFLNTLTAVAPQIAFSYMASKHRGASDRMGRKKGKQVGLTSKDLGVGGHGPPPLPPRKVLPTKGAASYAPMIGKAAPSSWMHRTSAEIKRRGQALKTTLDVQRSEAALAAAQKAPKRKKQGILKSLKSSYRAQKMDRGPAIQPYSSLNV